MVFKFSPIILASWT